jgi:serine/threonine protein kinase
MIDPLIGQTLGQYELQDRLGRGGMAAVYRAVQPALGHAVAVKVLPLAQLPDPTLPERFRREARMAANLRQTKFCSPRTGRRCLLSSWFRAHGSPPCHRARISGSSSRLTFGTPAGTRVRRERSSDDLTGLGSAAWLLAYRLGFVSSYGWVL